MLKTSAPKARSAGFTLTEMLIAVAILGTLVMLALPNFQQMLRNWEVRAAAESVANGLMRARAEAVSRNSSVQFVLGPGTNWTVDLVTKPVPTDPPLDSRPSTEGSPNTSASGLASDSTAATTATFNNLGQVIANPVGTVPLKTLVQVDFTVTGGTQPLRVLLGAGGSARVCDPSLPSTNVRAC